MLMGRDEKMNIREPKNVKAGEKGNLSAGGRGRKGGREGHGCGRTNLDSVTTAMVHCGDFLLSLRLCPGNPNIDHRSGHGSSRTCRLFWDTSSGLPLLQDRLSSKWKKQVLCICPSCRLAVCTVPLLTVEWMQPGRYM